jgi:predicted permease
MDTLRLDLKYAIRALLGRPGFSALAVLTLALGIGVNTVAFGALNALIYKPTSLPGAESLGWILGRVGASEADAVSWPDYRHFAQNSRSFGAIAAEGRLPLSLQREGAAEQVWSLVVSTNYLSMLGVRPERGRLFTPDDVRASEIAAVVSHRFWNNRLGGAESIAGSTVTLNGRMVSIVGVLPDDFQGPGGLFEPDIWIPLERLDALNARRELLNRTATWLTMVGRLREGVTPQQAQGELDSLSARLAADFPATNESRSVRFVPMRDGHPDVRALAPVMWIALAVVALVLLIACFNVASLLLARASERRRELGVRSALGASRIRVLRPLIVESLVLALASGIASLIVAMWSADLLATFSLPAPIPQRLHIGVDPRLIGFVAAMVALAGVLPALVPAVNATRADLLSSLRTDSAAAGTRSRTRNGFVIAQIAGSTVFLAAALLFARSYLAGAATDPGFDTRQALVLELTPSTYGYDAVRSESLMRTLVERVRALPGVTAVALADRVPFYVGMARELQLSAGDSDCAGPDCGRAIRYDVGPQHFAALGVRVLSGREFTESDVKHGAAAVISAGTAARLWPGRRAVGQWLRLGQDGRQVQVIGVVADITHRGLGEPPKSYVYLPLGVDAFAGPISMVVQVTGEPTAFIAPIQAQLLAIDSSLPPGTVHTMEQRMELPLWAARTMAGFFLICGVLSVTLATIGLFGVTYYAVSQRTREFGIRTALGATPRTMIWLVLHDGLTLAAPGIALGLCGALAAGRVVANLLYGVSASDPLTFAAAAGFQLLVALLASALPAARAAASDPIRALRQD